MRDRTDSLQDSVEAQRQALMALLHEPLLRLATAVSLVWEQPDALNRTLAEGLATIPHARYVYALDTNGRQISYTHSAEGPITADLHRDRSQRPYMCEAVPLDGFLLSKSYISPQGQRPSLTAIQLVRGRLWEALGFVGAYFNLRDLPLTRPLYAEPRRWLQLRGDPSIRGTVFHQQRSESELDRHWLTVSSVIEELMCERGVHHVMLHFSSSRAVVWTVDDPYRYRLLDIHALTDPDICLAFPRHPYPAEALVPSTQVRAVLSRFADLRRMDDTFYLRSGTLNVFNGLVGLTFSCDGSHYIPHEQFLAATTDFWLGGAAGS